MSKYLTIKNLKLVAFIIWILIGISILSRGFMMASDYAKQFTLLTDFFDLAHKRMAQPWEHFEEDMQKDHERFEKKSEEFHRFMDDQWEKRMGFLGYKKDPKTGEWRYEEKKRPEIDGKKIVDDVRKKLFPELD